MAAVYFDHNATTPLDPRVREAMLPWMGERHGNVSSAHRFGQMAREAVEEARERVASLIGAAPPEIVFTGSGTEANNSVILSCARRAGFSARVVISKLEHPSVRAACELVEELGGTTVAVAAESDGCVRAESVLEAVGDDTCLVAVMLANNEIGTLQPVRRIADGCRERGVPVLCDAVQAIGKVPVNVEDLGADYLTLGAHKFYGPLGAAALWVKKGVDYSGLLVGGGQERRRRAGTENVPAIVGMGVAAALAEAELEERRERMESLRDRFEAIVAGIGGVGVHGAGAPRLPNTSHLSFAGIDAEALMIRLDLAGFAVSTGSACSSGAVDPSKTLLSMGMSAEEALSSVRVSFGTTNTEAEVDAFVSLLEREVGDLRRRSLVAG